MSRDKPEGSEFTARNGYSYRKVKGKWKPLHYIILEEKLGRPVDSKAERAVFIDKNRTNLSPSNLMVQPLASKDTIRSKQRRIATLQDKIREMTAEVNSLQTEINELKLAR